MTNADPQSRDGEFVGQEKQMSKIGSMLAAIAIAAVAMPAAAGSWPNNPRLSKGSISPAAVAPQSRDGFVELQGDAMSSLEQYRYFPSEEYRGKAAFAFDASAAAQGSARAVSKDGFEFIGGDAGWQLSQHKYVLTGGRLAHSDECDHAIRVAKAPTAGEVEESQKLSPGE